MKDYSKKIRVVTFMLAVCIVWIHNYPVMPLEKNSGEIPGEIIIRINQMKDNLLASAVPMYFLISSFLFFNNYENKGIRKVATRFFSLGVPFVLWNIVAYFTVVLFSMIKGADIDAPNTNILISVINSTCSPLWFLRYLLILVILSPVLYVLIRKKKHAICFLGAVIVCSLIFSDNIPIFPNYYLPVWVIGGIMAIHYKNDFLKETRIGKEKTIMLLLTCVIVVIVSCIDVYKYDIILHIYQLITPLIYWMVMDCFSFKWINHTYMNCSLFIYVTHFNINRLILGLADGVVVNWWQTYLLYLLLPVCVITTIVGLGMIWMKLAPKTWKIVNGGR